LCEDLDVVLVESVLGVVLWHIACDSTVSDAPGQGVCLTRRSANQDCLVAVTLANLLDPCEKYRFRLLLAQFKLEGFPICGPPLDRVKLPPVGFHAALPQESVIFFRKLAPELAQERSEEKG
jgi:hypothetical protein